jgi:hypothetical protein
MKMIFMGLAAVWVLSSAPCCPPENQDLAKTMLLFDQGYIPAWYYAKTGDMVKAKKAVFYLEFQWQRLQLAWNSQLAEFPETGLALPRASARLSEAYVAIDNNDPVRATRSLERAQEELRQLRAGCGMSYFLDPWYALESDLWTVLTTLKDPQLQLMEWEEVTEMALSCALSWNAVSQTPMDTRLLDWEEAEKKRFDQSPKNPCTKDGRSPAGDERQRPGPGSTGSSSGIRCLLGWIETFWNLFCGIRQFCRAEYDPASG